jgi:hypothetical protein
MTWSGYDRYIAGLEYGHGKIGRRGGVMHVQIPYTQPFLITVGHNLRLPYKFLGRQA